MKRFILHVGFHKTATSSIQQTLAQNQSNLRAQGFYYPIFKYNNQDIINHSIPFYSVFCDRPDLYHINVRNGDSDRVEEVNASYISSINEILSLNENVIISGEDISVLEEEALEVLKNKIISSGFQLEVYCSVRRPYSFACSELQERIKNGVADFHTMKVLTKVEHIKKLQKIFSTYITFFNFEKDCEEEGPVVNFLKRIGVNETGIILTNDNEGFGNISTRVLAHLNTYFPIIKNGRMNINGRSKFTQSIDDTKFLLTKSEYLSISSELDTENTDISLLLGDSFADPKISFSTKTDLDMATAFKIYKTYSQKHTSKEILRFIKQNSSFCISQFADFVGNDAVLYRDIAILFEGEDLNQALEFMLQAKKIREDGPFINEKIKIYKEAIQMGKLNF